MQTEVILIGIPAKEGKQMHTTVKIQHGKHTGT